MTFQPHELTEKGEAVFKKFMKQGYDEVYFKEARQLLERNPGPLIVKRVLGEQQFLLHQEHGWDLHQAESRAYGQLFTHRWMKIDREKLAAEVEAHDAAVAGANT